MRTVDEIKKDIAKVNSRLEYISELESKMAARQESLEKELEEAYAVSNPFSLIDRYGDKCNELDMIWFVNDFGYIDWLDVNHDVTCEGTDEWLQKYRHLQTVNNNTAGVYTSKETADFALKKIRLLNVMLYFKDKFDIEKPLKVDSYVIQYSLTKSEYYFLSSSKYYCNKQVSGERDPFVIWFNSVQAVERCVNYLNSHKELFS